VGREKGREKHRLKEMNAHLIGAPLITSKPTVNLTVKCSW